jgi:hypothetical protein
MINRRYDEDEEDTSFDDVITPLIHSYSTVRSQRVWENGGSTWGSAATVEGISSLANCSNMSTIARTLRLIRVKK